MYEKNEDFLVAREQKLGTRGHQALLEYSPDIDLVTILNSTAIIKSFLSPLKIKKDHLKQLMSEGQDHHYK